MPHSGISCQDSLKFCKFHLRWIASDYQLTDIINGVMEGMELDNVKLRFIENIQIQPILHIP
jgi:hypothetical protein